MYAKCNCPYCEKTFFNDTGFSTVEKSTGLIIEEVDVSETITEDEMIRIVLRFMVKCLSEGVKVTDINERVSHCLNISPSCTDELILKIFSEHNCKITL